MSKKVVKFGGSSLASAEQFEKVGNIIRSEQTSNDMYVSIDNRYALWLLCSGRSRRGF